MPSGSGAWNSRAKIIKFTQCRVLWCKGLMALSAFFLEVKVIFFSFSCDSGDKSGDDLADDRSEWEERELGIINGCVSLGCSVVFVLMTARWAWMKERQRKRGKLLARVATVNSSLNILIRCGRCGDFVRKNNVNFGIYSEATFDTPRYNCGLFLISHP